MKSFAILCLLSLPFPVFAQAGAPSNRSAAAASYGNLPLIFEANQGQSDPSVQFLAHGQGYTLFLRQGEAVLSIRNAASASSLAKDKTSQPQRAPASFTVSAATDSTTSLIRMQLVGTNPRAQAIREDEQTTKTNYFLGKDPTQWHTGIPNYSRVRYRSIYEGIDQVYYGNQRQLEHDFIVEPNADPRKIVLAFDGAQRLRIDAATGDLILATTSGELRLQKPRAYQEEPSRKRAEIPSSYKLIAANKVTFALGSYNHAEPLIIDPVLVYSTYLGGNGTSGLGDQGNGIAIDSAGEAYIVGTTYSANFPVTTGAFQTTNNAAAGDSTVFVSKLNAAGTALIYSTYLGGSGGDFGYGIALDSANDAYITGSTRSTDFPITCGAYQTAFPSTTSGATTAFAAKLTPDGTGLLYSTYLGGTGNQSTPALGDVAEAIAVDSSGDAYLAGYTYSADFPTTTAAFQAKYAGSATTSNAFVTKLSPAGTSLLYSTYLGGSGVQAGAAGYSAPAVGDYGNAIAIDSSGDAFIAGATASSDFPVTKAAFQTGLLGPSNAFVTELNPAGSAEVYSTFLGGSGQPFNIFDYYPPAPTGDTASALAVDTGGNAYVAGTTTSSNFPVTAGALEGASDFDGTDSFVTKLNADGSALVYSTYLQGAETSVSALAVDSSGTAYIAGTAPTAGSGVVGGFVTTTDALPLSAPASNGNSAFVVKLNATGTALNYATLLGGNSSDGASALAVDSAGDVYITGSATSTNFPVSTGAFQTTNKAAPSGNAFVSQLALGSEANQTTYPPLPTGIATTMTDAGSSISLTFCDPNDYSADAFTFTANAILNKAASGPPPTGTIVFTDSFNYIFPNPYQIPFTGSWGSQSTNLSFTDGENSDAPLGPFEVTWTASYSGDAVYSASSVSGSASSPGCPSSPTVVRNSTPNGQIPRIEVHLPGGQTIASSGAASVNAPSAGHGAKFTPPAATASESTQKLDSRRNTSNAETPACLAPPPTAVPVLSPVAGTYTTAQSVTISDTTPGATVYYTTDGSTPSASSTQYTAAVGVGATETINAIAIAPEYSASTVASALYTINFPAATAPTFSPAAGTYTSTQSVILADTTPGAAIYYTTDGSTPSASSTAYSAPISVAATETINAIAIASGYLNSPEGSALYTINLPPPAFTVSVSQSSLTIEPGQSGTVTISVTPQNGFAAATTFSCTGLPAGATCSFSPASVTPTGGAATTTLTVTASANASLSPDSRSQFPGRLPGATLALALCCIGWRKRRSAKLLIALAVLSLGAGLLAGCGGSSSPKPVTSQVSVIATSGALQQTVPLTITIQ